MGADFISSTLTWDKNRKLDWDAGFELIKKIAKESFDPEFHEDIGEVPVDSNGLYTYAEIKEFLAEIRNIVEGKQYNREATIFNVGHLNILITGGMSWGDSPSELYNTLCGFYDVDELDVTIGFNLDDIDYKALLLKILEHQEILPLIIGLDEDLDKMVEVYLKKGTKRGRKRRTVNKS